MTILLDASTVERPRAEPWRGNLARLFSSPLSTVLTLVGALVVVLCVWQFFRWAILDAAWSGGPEACQARAGACWTFVWANARLMFFGVYPEAELWRAAVSLVLMAAVIVASMVPALWGWPLIVAWAATPILVCSLLAGVLSGTRISTNAWGGLPLTLLVVPMMLPGVEVNLFVSVEVALILFVASYLAEVIRAGL
jgi:general L-amino acid transport system permease protein